MSSPAAAGSIPDALELLLAGDSEPARFDRGFRGGTPASAPNGSCTAPAWETSA